MRYIKSFRITESSNQRKLHNQYIDEVKDLAESSLVYLLDEGFKLEYYPGVGQELSIKFVAEEGGVKWGDIKDYFISFLERLKNDYIVQENALVQFDDVTIKYGKSSSDSMNVAITTLIRDYSEVNPDWWSRFCDSSIRNIFVKILVKR